LAEDIRSFGDLTAESNVIAIDDISAGRNLKVGGNASIIGGKMSLETNRPVFRLGRVQNSSINASLYFGSSSRGYINVSTFKDGTDLVDDMTIAAGRNIDLKCENINLVAATTVDGGLSVNGLIIGSGRLQLDSSIITKSNTSIGNKLFVKGTTTLTGNSSINASLFVKNDVSLGGKLYTYEIRTPRNASIFNINSST